MTDKIFQSYRSQINILRQRGLRVQNVGRAIKILEQENYYKLINGYKEPFLEPDCTPERFKAGTDFSEIYALCLFDRAIRSSFLGHVLRVENHVKSVLAYEFSSRYQHDRYLRLANFNMQPESPKRLQRISQLIADIMGDIADHVEKKHPAIEHYVQKHGYAPLWVLVNVLTLGRISTFYANLKLEDRQSVAKHFSVQENFLETYLRVLTLFRNCCAHDDRFYSYRSTIGISDTEIHERLDVYRNKQGQYLRGKKDVFALLIVLKIMLPQQEFSSLVREVSRQVDRLEKKMKSVSINEILRKMGFPQNWQDIQQHGKRQIEPA